MIDRDIYMIPEQVDVDNKIWKLPKFVLYIVLIFTARGLLKIV